MEDASLHKILEQDLGASDPQTLEENEAKQALLKRPSFSVKLRLTILFLAFLAVSAGASITTMFTVRSLDYRVQFVTLADGFANEIQHARRSEKNFFLYGTDLAEVLDHITAASDYWGRAAQEFGHVVSAAELDSITRELAEYRSETVALMEKAETPGFKESEGYQAIAQSLREHGSSMLELSLDISRRERQIISATTKRAMRIQFFLLGALLLSTTFIAVHIYRHIILRLNRLLEATQKFARGDFLPITPKRKYRDEFSHLAIALNHTMYELDRRQTLLVESHKMRAIGNLTAGVAHELNNPLNNIILTSEVLKQNYHELSESEIEEMVNDLVTQGERAQRVVKNLLDFARESETKTEYIHIDKLIDDTVQLARNQIKLSKIKLDVTVDKNLPPLYGDRELLKQVFLNLFINAIDAMPDGGVLTIGVTEEIRTGFMAIQIADTGSGIPTHILNSIFNPFFTTKPTGKGTGLGLAVSRGIIEKHGGEIAVESKPGEGARFTVYLPIVPIPAGVSAG